MECPRHGVTGCSQCQPAVDPKAAARERFRNVILLAGYRVAAPSWASPAAFSRVIRCGSIFTASSSLWFAQVCEHGGKNPYVLEEIMTAVALLRRFGTNVRTFPTLAKVAAVVLVASLGEIALIVGILNHSTLDGVIASGKRHGNRSCCGIYRRPDGRPRPGAVRSLHAAG